MKKGKLVAIASMLLDELEDDDDMETFVFMRHCESNNSQVLLSLVK